MMTVDRFVRPALVVVDMQNDFVRVGAPLEVPTARATIPVHQTLLSTFRELNLPVVYTRFIAGPKSTLVWQWSPQHAPPVCCCWKGHRRGYADVAGERDCADVVDELSPEPGDPVVDKYGYDAFHNTNLNDILRAHHVASVVVTGTVTQICVEETARGSFQHGYPTTIVADAVSSYMPDLHDATLKNFAFKFGWVSSSAEVITEVRRRAGGGPRDGVHAAGGD
jgi:nicotinamidase-related amidase